MFILNVKSITICGNIPYDWTYTHTTMETKYSLQLGITQNQFFKYL